MSGLGETKFGFGSLMPTATRLPRVSSDFHSGSGVGAGAGRLGGAAWRSAVGVACARGGRRLVLVAAAGDGQREGAGREGDARKRMRPAAGR